MIRIALVVFALALAACSSKPAPATPSGDTGEPAGEPAEKVESPSADADWDAYWAEFKKVAKDKDKEAMKALCQVGGAIDQATFDMLFDSFLTEEVLAALESTEADKVAWKEIDGDQVREFSWSETAEIDGQEVGTALFFHFKKVDGSYKLVQLLAAG